MATGLVLLFSCFALALTGVLGAHTPSKDPGGGKEQGRVADALSQIINPLTGATKKLMNAFLKVTANDPLTALQKVISGKNSNRGNQNAFSSQNKQTANNAHKKSKSHWQYDTCSVDGPIHWPEQYPDCAGFLQSPINIVTPIVVYNRDFRLQFEGPMTAIKGTFINNGHCPTFFPARYKHAELKMRGVPYDPKTYYTLEQLHIHFSGDNQQGSEHSVNGEKFDAEMHLVFRNSKYRDFDVATNYPDGLSVVAVFFEVGNPATAAISQIITGCNYIRYPKMKYNMTLHSLNFLSEMTSWYTYKGSLTTPGCQEAVRWIIMKDPLTIGYTDLKILEKLVAHDGTPLAKNIRPIQPRSDRKVEANFPNPVTNKCSSYNDNLDKYGSSRYKAVEPVVNQAAREVQERPRKNKPQQKRKTVGENRSGNGRTSLASGAGISDGNSINRNTESGVQSGGKSNGATVRTKINPQLSNSGSRRRRLNVVNNNKKIPRPLIHQEPRRSQINLYQHATQPPTIPTNGPSYNEPLPVDSQYSYSGADYIDPGYTNAETGGQPPPQRQNIYLEPGEGPGELPAGTEAAAAPGAYESPGVTYSRQTMSDLAAEYF